MEIKNQSRNNSIDVFKAFLLIFILTAHALPNAIPKVGSTAGVMFCLHLNSFSRLVVPIFFILTGYFLRNRLLEKVYIVKYLKRLTILFVVWQLIYLKFNFTAYQNNFVTIENFILDLFWGIAHLWYLNATILAVLFIFLIRNFKIKTKFIIAFFLLLLCYFLQILTKYQTAFEIDEFKQILKYFGTERNFLFYGVPCGNVMYLAIVGHGIDLELPGGEFDIIAATAVGLDAGNEDVSQGEVIDGFFDTQIRGAFDDDATQPGAAGHAGEKHGQGVAVGDGNGNGCKLRSCCLRPRSGIT